MVEDLPKLIVITGPTCSGKSVLAVELARILGGEIINADSMQVYRGMDIGTSKLPMSERKGIPHHLIDIINPDQEFNASLFLIHAQPIIEDLHSKKIPIIVVGGTGLYIKTLVGGLFKCPPSDQELRRNLWKECENRGSPFLHERLSMLDKEAANSIHSMDKIRIIRALEVICLTGSPFSELTKKHGFSDRKFLTLKFCLNIDRKTLYARIDKRTVTMIDSGLIDEVKELLGMGYGPELRPMRAIGYKHIIGYIEGKRNLDETIGLIQRDTRRYAKRQLTWFKADPDTIWINPDNKKDIINKIHPRA
ncbi:MAG TPA: tRNA (adenosine(37)-N6)-dimethylallyltransferase MiaA [Desulfatiglandales bacterium]|nr:tRNA (adenosine(37)-N6)-dimethylallyltransferase MiaA [Desulfatiglandales bacterium]